MQKGILLGKGMTAEVYEWGQDKVLKLYYEVFSNEWINHEAKVGKAVHKAGIPSPAVFETISVGNRKGTIFERIFGKPLLKHLEAEPWKAHYLTQQSAELQIKIHKYSSENLPSQKDNLTSKINPASRILGSKKDIIIEYLKNLPDGNSVCHGDFHFNNIIVSDKGLIPVDWTNAYLGNPFGDVARTWLILNSPSRFTELFNIMSTSYHYTKQLPYWQYLNEYIRLSNASFESIDEWILPIAAAKLADRIPGEEKWLMNIINARLENI
ncbi:MAG: phosphotransferase [Clostridiaceae bacterium]|nr:phosphotransferase [Clostridiaceae bacterium]